MSLMPTSASKSTRSIISTFLCLLLAAVLCNCELLDSSRGERDVASTRVQIDDLWADVCRIEADFQSGFSTMTNTGAGVFLPNGIVLTAGHVLMNVDPRTQIQRGMSAIRITPWSSGQQSSTFNVPSHTSGGTVFPKIDLALIPLGHLPPGTSGIPLSNTPALVGDEVYIFLLSNQRDLSAPGGRFSFARRVTAEVSAISADMSHFFIFGEAIPGDSGGPVVNADGELVGILIASGPLSTRPVVNIDWTRQASPLQVQHVEQPTIIAVDLVRTKILRQ